MKIELKIKPISINAAYQGRRFKTQECKEYEKQLCLLLPFSKSTMTGEIEIYFTFYLKNYKKTDISNLVKVTEDILVKRGYFEDDRKIKKMHLEKIESEEDKIVVILNKLKI